MTETPEFIGLDEFSVSGRRLYHTAICNLVKGEVMEVVEGQGRQKEGGDATCQGEFVENEGQNLIKEVITSFSFQKALL